jgi:predicted DNA-binding transcriptional regulator YafY
VSAIKINRLLEITIILLNKGTVTAKELAERFEVSTRTIYRDIDVLSSAGVPVFTNKGSGGGISLLESYTINKALISEHERESILLALKTLQAIKYPEIDLIIDKIGAVFKNTAADDWVYIDFSPWGSKPNEDNKFIDIKKSIMERRLISFDYVNAEGGKSRRSIEPMRLVFKAQAWYLWGYCRSRQAFRTFRISRVKNLTVTSESFECREHDSAQKERSVEKPKELVTLKLRFQPEALHRLYDDFDDEMITKNADGTCDVIVTLPEGEWVYGYILSYGCQVKVIEPEHVRQIVIDRLKKTWEIYE